MTRLRPAGGRRRPPRLALAAAAAAVLVGLAALGALVVAPGHEGGREHESRTLSAWAAQRRASLRGRPAAVVHEHEGEPSGAEGEGGREGVTGPAAQLMADRAWPRAAVDAARPAATRAAFRRIPGALSRTAFRTRAAFAAAVASAVRTRWEPVGPRTGFVPGEVAGAGQADTTVSGRVTALAVDPGCGLPGRGCRVWVGAAGGGVWRSPDALGADPAWAPASSGIPSGAIGSLAVDPNDPSGNTLYAGTGEPNGSGDSEAGVGLYRSRDGGDSWSPVPGSAAVATGRSIAAISVDPGHPGRLRIGTAVARHGLSSVQGGRVTPPAAPQVGLYRSTDGGASFSLQFSRPANGSDPALGSDWFQGGVNKIVLDPTDPANVYVAVIGYGIWRSAPSLEGGDASFHQVFATMNPTDTYGDRSEFDLAALPGRGGAPAALRAYVGDASDDQRTAELWRGDDMERPASALTDGTYAGNSSGYTKLSSPDNGTPGFGSRDYCQNGQCGYDDFVAADPNAPDTVWIGGSMAYDELAGGAAPRRSNGRAVMRSTNAGVDFADMTQDAGSPRPTGMHADQHAIAFAPRNTAIAFIGSDGGVVRTDGSYVDGSAACAGRALAAAEDRADCASWLSSIPHRIVSLNDGLATLQFQGLSPSPRAAGSSVMGGTQDNGTWSLAEGRSPHAWIETAGGDGGWSGFDAMDPSIRLHTYFEATPDVNYAGDDPTRWLWIGDPLQGSSEQRSFFAPFASDPRVPHTIFAGLQHVWRTPDDGGPRAALEAHCAERALDGSIQCGDWRPLGPDLTSASLGDRDGQFVAAVERAPSDAGTLWAATRTGRLFVSRNANAADPSTVTFARIDTPRTPGRFVSGIAVDPRDANHAWISYSGYGAYTRETPQHVLEARLDPAGVRASFEDRSANLGDQPILDVVRDSETGDLYAATDFGVMRLAAGSAEWTQAAAGMPPVATYGLAIDGPGRLLYAATHGRGAWRLPLPRVPVAAIDGPSRGEVGSTVSFSAARSHAYDGGALRYRWSLPGRRTAGGAVARVRLTSRGTVAVSLLVTDADGRTGAARVLVRVVDRTRPLVRVAALRGAAGRAAVLEARVLDAGGIRSIAVSFGDGSRRARVRAGRTGLVRVRHAWRRPGRYRIAVAAVDDAGLRTLRVALARIHAPPHALRRRR